MEKTYKCSFCGRTDVKLWHKLGAGSQLLACRKCTEFAFENAKIVPAIPDECDCFFSGGQISSDPYNYWELLPE